MAVFAARARLMTAHFDYYRLAHPDEGVGAGFRYHSVDKVSAKARVTGPFTVEAVPPPPPAQVTSVDEIGEGAEAPAAAPPPPGSDCGP